MLGPYPTNGLAGVDFPREANDPRLEISPSPAKHIIDQLIDEYTARHGRFPGPFALELILDEADRIWEEDK